MGVAGCGLEAQDRGWCGRAKRFYLVCRFCVNQSTGQLVLYKEGASVSGQVALGALCIFSDKFY